MKSKKCAFIKDQLKANIAKPSKLWKVLKSLGLSSKGSTNAKVCLKENDLAHSLVDKLPASPKIFTMETTKEYYDEFDIQNSLNLEMVDSSIISDLLSKTNISKAAGIDKLSGTFIKDGAESIANHFTKIINLSIESSLFQTYAK